jgi:hypothetical protein
MSELLERMKASFPPGWDDPNRQAHIREWNRRHDFLRQLQSISASKKIQYMSPGLYRYPGVKGKTFREIFLIDENHRLWESHRFWDDVPGGQEINPAGGLDPDMLWRFRRIA